MTDFTEIKGAAAQYVFEGEAYEYDPAAVKSIAMARCMYKAAADPDLMLDAWEATFGANADAYWAQIADDEKAAALITSIYRDRAKN